MYLLTSLTCWCSLVNVLRVKHLLFSVRRRPSLTTTLLLPLCRCCCCAAAAALLFAQLPRRRFVVVAHAVVLHFAASSSPDEESLFGRRTRRAHRNGPHIIRGRARAHTHYYYTHTGRRRRRRLASQYYCLVCRPCETCLPGGRYRYISRGRLSRFPPPHLPHTP